MTKPHTTLSEAVRALETIERGEIEVFDDDLRENVIAPMSTEEIQEVARTALTTIAALLEQHEAQEPVAWRYRVKLGCGDWSEWRPATKLLADTLVDPSLYEVQPLYAQPTLAATQADEGREAQVLRRLLAYRVAGAKLYADDGELQDNTTWPHIDFRRDSVDTIENKLGDRTRAAFAKLTPEQIDAAMSPTTTTRSE